uniref:Uncharacterized protein n=1 Tax=Lactuca sativa TaxID=4236 RepID=A0A9R1UU40_LACSA|nr:hypothetical protein LSAT_V11C800438030 [Lactuca sativa]
MFIKKNIETWGLFESWKIKLIIQWKLISSHVHVQINYNYSITIKSIYLTLVTVSFEIKGVQSANSSSIRCQQQPNKMNTGFSSVLEEIS